VARLNVYNTVSNVGAPTYDVGRLQQKITAKLTNDNNDSVSQRFKFVIMINCAIKIFEFKN